MSPGSAIGFTYPGKQQKGGPSPALLIVVEWSDADVGQRDASGTEEVSHYLRNTSGGT